MGGGVQGIGAKYRWSDPGSRERLQHPSFVANSSGGGQETLLICCVDKNMSQGARAKVQLFYVPKTIKTTKTKHTQHLLKYGLLVLLLVSLLLLLIQ